ncbi:MAG: DUF188 domain-containing protein [Sphaerochaetaceae bacterium]
MSDLRLYVDADSVPVPIRAIILRASSKRMLPVLFVADRLLKDVRNASEQDTHNLRKEAEKSGELDKSAIRTIKSGIAQVTVPSGMNSADDYLVGHVTVPSIAITHDIPLAYRLVAEGAVVLDDRGNVYTKENVGVRLSERNVNKMFREWGIAEERTRPLSPAQVKAFADALDRTITHMQ